MTINPAEKPLYDLLFEAGCKLDSWQSDLYVVATPEARAIIQGYEAAGHISNKRPFRGNDGVLWIELPFHNLPWWTARTAPTVAAPEEAGPRM